MEYVNLGASGLKVSRFGYGNLINCSQDEDPKEVQERANSFVKFAFDNGINFFDTAEFYGFGQAERQMGEALRALKVPRTDYVLATKIFFGNHPQNINKVNVMGTSRKHLIEGVNRSLENLKHDYVDVLLCHRWDPETPVSEVCHAMKAIIESGKALYWGTSEWPGIRIMEAILICDKIGAPRPITEQSQYNLLEREKIEKEYVALFDDYNYGTTTWSPLAYGILTGKYNNGIPEGSRATLKNDHSDLVQMIFNRFLGEKTRDSTISKLKKLEEVAKSLDCSMPQLAVAWVIKNNDVSTCLLGASSTKQIEENLKALDISKKMNKDTEAKINEILENKPSQELNYRLRKPLPDRRS